MRTVKKFTNYTNEDFSFAWDGVPYVVKAGQSMNLPDYLADHAAYHLVNREIQKPENANLIGAMYSDTTRQPFLDKCLSDVVDVPANDTAAEVAAMNPAETPEVVAEENPVEEVEKAPKEEETFEGLENETPTA